MDWQQPLALLIVCATAVAFLWSKTRGRTASALPFAREGHCGCGSGNVPAIGPKQSVTFRARKGERPRVLIKNQ
jgi:hypothetical protein